MTLFRQAAPAVLAATWAATWLDGRRGRSLARISRVVADLDRAETFYRDGLGFSVVARGLGDPDAGIALGLPGAIMHQLVLRLGNAEIALVRFDPPGEPYPADSRSDDLWFQHLAIVVNDMPAALAILQRQAPTPISTAGPQTLPPRNGPRYCGVAAFKFRDPDGHPLELLHFPPGQGRPLWHHPGPFPSPFLGIDHTALSVSSTARSVRFYHNLGFHVANRSNNAGPAQDRLDGLDTARLRVIGLRLPRARGPGIELLGYHPPGRLPLRHRANDVLTDWTTVVAPAGHAPPKLLRDPDGHRVLLVSRPPA